MDTSPWVLGARRYNRVQLLVVAVLAALAGTIVSLVASAALSDAVGESAYVPLTPARILDTRTAATGSYSSVTGGTFNVASGFFSSVSGGFGRSVNSANDWRAGALFQDS